MYAHLIIGVAYHKTARNTKNNFDEIQTHNHLNKTGDHETVSLKSTGIVSRYLLYFFLCDFN